jgi:hypothetical protein
MDLLVTSNMAQSYRSPNHDPANFIVQIPNTTMISKVVKSVPKMITIPRLFYNVTRGNNVIYFEFTDQLYTATVPPALYTTAKFLEVLNNQLPANLRVVRDQDLLIRMTPTFYSSPTLTALTRVYIQPKSDFARYLGWQNLTSTPTLVIDVVSPNTLDWLTLPQLGGPQCVNVTVKCLGPQQIYAQDGCEIASLAVVPMSCAVGETAFFQSQETFVNDIDHNTQPRNYSLLEVSLRDAWTNEPLTLPSICTVSILFKLYHVDTLRE